MPEPPRRPLTLAEPHVLVETDEGPSAGLLVELDDHRARVMYAWDDEAGSQGLLETWVDEHLVTSVETTWPIWPPPPPPRPSLPR